MSTATARANAVSGQRRQPSQSPVKPHRSRPVSTVAYRRVEGGVDAYVRALADASPLQIVELERKGVDAAFVKDLARRMGITASRFFVILGLPKATVEKKAAAGETVGGSGGRAVVGMVKLLALAQRMVRDSTAPEARGFDTARWLGRWIEQPQPALGGRRPSELIDTPTGIEVVARLLGAMESGAYQ